MRYPICLALVWFVTLTLLVAPNANGDGNDPGEIAARAMLKGDPQRGAMIFYRSAAACATCHVNESGSNPLGPALTTIDPNETAESIVESILSPSKTIRKGYETVRLLTLDGEIKTGMVAEETDTTLRLRDATNLLADVVVKKAEIEDRVTSGESMMPAGLVDSFSGQRDLIDLVSYVLEVARGGPERESELRPSEDDLRIVDDTLLLDHASILESLDDQDLKVGRRIYMSHCQNCHGQDGNTPTLATARAFGTQPLRHGSDPYRMLATLTRGAGLMASVQYLTPKERYQVIHFIREELMKPSNPDYAPLNRAYLETLPKGDDLGKGSRCNRVTLARLLVHRLATT